MSTPSETGTPREETTKPQVDPKLDELQVIARPVVTCSAQAEVSPARSRLDLLGTPLVKRLLRWRGFQFTLQLPNVLVYLLVIVTGFYGTQSSTQNFATVVTWIIWWAAIVFTFVFVGRLWCLMCPFSAMAEWLQRFSLWAVKRQTFSLNRKWPLKLRNLYLAAAMFLLLTWVDNRFGLVGSPLYTAYFVLVILAAAIMVGLIFERRTFCRYVCPIGGLIGTYALFASAELRVVDRKVCRGHKEKNCLLGSGTAGYGCPVRTYPGDMDSNYSCTLCTECIKTCPKNNIALNVRPFAHDLVNLNEKRLGLDMAILAVVLLGLPTYQTIIMITPWEGWMQWLQRLSGLPEQVVFSLVFLASTLAIPLGLFLGTTFVTKLLARGADVTQRRLFINFAYAFVPIGLMMHLAHNVKHLLGEGQTIIPVLSDPFGWGWNLFGTSKLQLSSIFSTDVLTAMQFGLLLVGQGFAVYVVYRIGHRLFGGGGKAFLRGLAPILVLAFTWSVFNLWVLSQPLMERH